MKRDTRGCLGFSAESHNLWFPNHLFNCPVNDVTCIFIFKFMMKMHVTSLTRRTVPALLVCPSFCRETDAIFTILSTFVCKVFLFDESWILNTEVPWQLQSQTLLLLYFNSFGNSYRSFTPNVTESALDIHGCFQF